jgi:hypothetical protein
MEGEELQIMFGSLVEPLPNFCIEGLPGLLRSSGGLPGGSHILHLQLIGSTSDESTNEK